MVSYKRYLISGGKVPRQTLWNRRRASRLRATISSQLSSESRREAHPGPRISTSENSCEAVQCPPPMVLVHAEVPAGRISPSNSLLEGSFDSVPGDQENSLENCYFPCDSDDNSVLQSVDLNGSIASNAEVADPIDSSGNCSASSSDSEVDFENQPVDLNGSIPINTENELLFAQQNESRSGGEENDKLQLQLPLCNCTSNTTGDVLFMVLSLGYKHSFSWEAQIDILNMVRSCHKLSELPSSKYKYFKFLDTSHGNIKTHVYCPECNVYLGLKTDLKDEKPLCKYCETVINPSKESNIFVSASIESQLQQLLKSPAFVDMLLNYRFNRVKVKEDAFEDIYDGEEYRKLVDNEGILSVPHNFSYSFFIDGIALGKASKRTIWPIYLTINELPIEVRSRYFILAGLYIGKKDPAMHVFLKPFVDEANRLSSEGFLWTLNNVQVVSHVIPLIAIADSAARYKLMNFQSYVAFYGCTFCYQKSERTRSGNKFTIPAVRAPERTEKSTLEDLSVAFQRRDFPEKDRHWKGVKGPSPLLKMKYFKLINGCIVDYMHTILLCVVKTHFELLFSPSGKTIWIGLEDQRIGIEHIKQTIDQRLVSITPPSFLTRTPRSVLESNFWKASEWRAWLLFYCLPCLEGLLKDKYLCHIAMLSKATILLLQESISQECIQEAHCLFMSFIYFFEKYFGQDHMTYSIHLLSHIVKGVKNWGPIWGHNGFCYESENRQILQFCNNSGHMVLNMTRKFLVYASLPGLFDKLVSSSSTIEFCEKSLNRPLKYYVRGKEGCLLIGKGENCTNLSPEELSLLENKRVNVQNCLKFNRFLYKSKRYTTNWYQEEKKNNDSCFQCTLGKYYVLQNIILLPGQEVLLFVKELKVSRSPVCSNSYVKPDHMKVVEKRSSVLCIEPRFIAYPCILMVFKSKYNYQNSIEPMDPKCIEYVCRVPFGCYGD